MFNGRHTRCLVISVRPSRTLQSMDSLRLRRLLRVDFHTLFDALAVRLPDTPGDSLRRLRHKSKFD